MNGHTDECSRAMYRGPHVCICGRDRRAVAESEQSDRIPRTALHAYLETADPIVAETAIALLDVELAEASAAPPEPPLDYDRMVEAGFLDAYLNIAGVEDEARAEELLREDIARYDEMGGAAPERLPVAPHPFIGEQRSSTHCLLFIEGGVTCKQPPNAPVHQS